MIGIIGAMQIEIDKINEALEEKEARVISGVTFTKGLLYGKEVVTAVSGVGKVFAAICAEAMILAFSPEIIINTGVGGSLSDELSIGDVAVADGVVQHDMDTSPIGDPVGLLSGINMIKIPSDKEVLSKMAQCVESLGARVRTGTIASGDEFVNSSEKKKWIKETFGAIACEMEGAAIGHVAYMNNVKFAVIRAISDGAGDESHMDYFTFVQKAAELSSAAVKLFVKNEENGRKKG